MRPLVCLLLLGSAFAQSSTELPSVRDAYVEQRGARMRQVRLKDSLQVAACKSDYDAWANGRNPAPSLSLYLDGRALEGVKPAWPQIDTASVAVDQRTRQIQETCADKMPDVLAAEKVASDKRSEAKIASDKVAGETDSGKKVLLTKQATDKAGEVKAAEDLVSALKEKNARYVFSYLDPQLIGQAETRDTWLRLLESPWRGRSVAVSLGPGTGPSGPSEAAVELIRLNLWWLIGWATLFVVAVVVFVRYAMDSDIIRDPGVLPAVPGAATPRKSYSLARSQMALWTFLVAGALAFIFLVTWNQNTITPGILVLIGISSGTALLAAVADNSSTPQVTKGFFTDLLSDGDGPSFHRYQMLLFTIILAVIFVVKTASGLVMPEFDATLLGLMGISSGTYLGFKLQGK